MSMAEISRSSGGQLKPTFMAGMDTNCMTVSRFIIEKQKDNPSATGEFTTCLNSLLTSIKAVSSAVRRAGIYQVHILLYLLGFHNTFVRKSLFLKCASRKNQTHINYM